MRRCYEDHTMDMTTEELAAYDVIRCSDINIVVELVKLGFDCVADGDEYVFIGTPKLLTVLRALNKIKEFKKN